MRNQIIALLAGTMLAGCGSNFTQTTTYDRKVFDAAGSITVSQAKLHSREALIDERRKDLAWIDKLIEESTDPSKVKFTPQLEREVETITAFSAALGLSFDPAAARSFDRSEETAEVKQQIDLLKLQFELEKVEQQIAAFKANPPEDLGLPESSAGGDSDGEPTERQTAALEKLEATVASLSSLTVKGLANEGKLPARLNFTTDPIDDFRDRLAYRNILRSARNSAALDELHDRGGNRLYRLNFQATALPDPDYLRSLGVVDMKIVPPDAAAAKEAFERWLDLINNDMAQRNDKNADKFRRKSDALEVANSPDLALVTHFGRQVVIPDEGANLRSVTKIIEDAESIIEGPGIDAVTRGNAYRNALISNESAVSTQIIEFMCAKTATAEQQAGWNALLAPFYETPPNLIIQQNDLYKLAKDVVSGEAYDDQRRLLGTPRSENYVQFSRILREKREGYETFKRAARAMGIQDCPNLDIPKAELALETTSLIRRMTSDPGSSKARIYEIGPRELVQQVSTLARAANTLAIAASAAANDPGSAISGSAAGAYSQSSAGRAAAIERVPSVVGYAQTVGDASHFGWVLGPQAALDPKGRIFMEQRLEPYDLAVDISVPGWWPHLKLHVATKWGPSSNTLANNGYAQSGGQTVPLGSDIDIRESLTALFSLEGSGTMAVAPLSDQEVSECYASTILVRGRNIWRTQKVVLGGMVIEGSNITITPDMRGILVSVPKIPEVLGLDNPDDLPITLLSPRETIDEDAKGNLLEVKFKPKPASGTCPGGTPKKPAATDQPQISQIANGTEHLNFFSGSAIDFGIKGKNLNKLYTKVSLGPADGKLVVSGSESGRVQFDSAVTNLPPDTYTLTFYAKDKDGNQGAAITPRYRVEISNKKDS